MRTTIAINFGKYVGFKSIEAETIEILQIPLAIHRTPNKSGWSITEPRTGFALTSRQPSKEAARFDVVNKIGTTGRDKVLAIIAATPSAPDVATLEAYVTKVKAPAAKVDVASIVAAIHNTVPLSEREKVAVARALNSRTGQLKAKAPSAFGDADERLAAAAWQGLQPNAFKVSIFSALALQGEARDLFERLSKVSWPAAFDKDKLALVNAGVW